MKNILLKTAMVLTLISLITACKPEEEALIEEPSQVEIAPDTPAMDPVSGIIDSNPDETLTLVSPALAVTSGASDIVNLQGFSDTSYDSAEFYFDSQCAYLIEQANQTQVANGGVNLNVNAQTTTEIYAQLFRNGTGSGCELILTYTHDTVAPTAPHSIQINTASAQQTQSVAVTGQVDQDTVSVVLFSDSTCQSQVGTGSADEFAQAVQFYFIDWNQETIIFAQAIDAAGNSSSCQEMARFDLSN